MYPPGHVVHGDVGLHYTGRGTSSADDAAAFRAEPLAQTRQLTVGTRLNCPLGHAEHTVLPLICGLISDKPGDKLYTEKLMLRICQQCKAHKWMRLALNLSLLLTRAGHLAWYIGRWTICPCLACSAIRAWLVCHLTNETR